jgi:hypothetical protein
MIDSYTLPLVLLELYKEMLLSIWLDYDGGFEVSPVIFKQYSIYCKLHILLSFSGA